MFLRNYIDHKLNSVFKNNPDPLNKYRAEFLVNSLLGSLILVIITFPGFYIDSLNFLFYRSLVIILLECFLLWAILNTKKWHLVAHATCILIAILILTNFFVLVIGVRIISLQYMLLLILLSYYLLGKKWGVFYSIMCTFFLSAYFLFLNTNELVSVKIGTSQYINFILIFLGNFLLIIYLHYHFFNAFNKTIKRLKIKQEEEELLNEKLQYAILASQQLDKAKTNFLSTISHELRTPLNSVIGISNILLIDKPREDQKENLDILKFSANNLLNLINNVLDINKIDSGNLEIENILFKFNDLIQHIYHSFKIKAIQKGINFNLEINKDLKGMHLIGDPTRLTQIMTNLIENAIKFTAEGSVDVSIQIKEKTIDTIKLHFCISDTGIGIPEDKHEVIFDLFSQASSSTTRNFGGTGLGLAIVKNLLILHQSEINIQSKLNIGTAFDFEIIYKIGIINSQSTSLIENEKDVEVIDISDLKILIAEDNQINVLLMRKLLSKWEIVPDFALNGSEAVEAFKKKHFDLILMDIHMPILDGYEATYIIRNNFDSPKSKTPIIALTASIDTDIKSKIEEVGINDYISKPFDHKDLKDKLIAIAKIKNNVGITN